MWVAIFTAALVFAAVIAAKLAKRDIDTQLQTSKEVINAQLRTASEAVEAQLKTSAEDLTATRAATEAAQRTAQRQTEASYTPLLIDVPPQGKPSPNDELIPTSKIPIVHVAFPGGHEAGIDPRRVYVNLSGPRINIAVPLRNRGNGLAVIQPQAISVGGPRIGETKDGDIVVQHERVPVAETTRVLCAPALTFPETADYPWVIAVTIPYTDFVGTQETAVAVQLEQPWQDGPWTLKKIEQQLLSDAPYRLPE